ncbi:MAG: site-2 protease family protein, partial [Pirellulales bacterium]
QIGMSNGDTCEVLAVAGKRLLDVAPGLAKIKPGDVIVAVNGEPVTEGWQLDRWFSRSANPLRCTIERTVRDETKPNEPPKLERLEVEVPAIPMRTVGLVMMMGKITAVQQGSPAERADIRPGDSIKAIDGEDAGDPMRLGRRLAQRSDPAVTITLERDGRSIEKQVELATNLVDNTAPDPLLDAEDIPIALPALGVAIAVENRVAAVQPGSPADAAGIKAGDEIVKASLLPPDADVQREKYDIKQPQEDAEELDFDGKRNWPLLFAALQFELPESQLELTLKGDRTVKLTPQWATDWYNAYRGFRLSPLTVIQKAENVPEALQLGGRETRYSLSLVFRFLRKLMSGQVSVKGIGGPVEIMRQAGATASAGISPFLIFLTMLSANLAVLNFLPIPMLDGGHMVFLVAEGVRGKPVSERVVACFQFAGLFLLASLMIFVLLLDVGVIPRG